MTRRFACIGLTSALIAFLLILLLSPLPVHAAGGITVSAVGDVMMGSTFPTRNLPRDRGRWLLREAAPFFKEADIAMANLEGTLTREGEPSKDTSTGRSYLFRSPPSYAYNLKEAGISMVSLANNHAMDFGREGFASTKRALEKAGVAYSSKSGEIAEFTVRGTRVGIVSLSFGPPPRSIVHPAKALDEIEQLCARYDILILFIHSGAEGRGSLHVTAGMETFLNEPRGDIHRFAHDAIDRGAALVISSGPHVPRALELYRGRLIAYSLGNFATYGGINVAGETGYAPLLTVNLAADGSFEGGSIRSFRQAPYTGPRLDPQRHALHLMQRLTEEDFPGSGLAFGATGELTVK